MTAGCTICPKTVSETSSPGRGLGTWGTQWMRELLPLLQSETFRNHRAQRSQGFRTGTEGWSPLQSGELSLREWGEGRRWRASGSMRWGELYETAGRWQGAEGIRGCEVGEHCRQLCTEGRQVEGLGTESTWRPASLRGSTGSRVGAPGSGGHQTQVMGLSCCLCLRAGWG